MRLQSHGPRVNGRLAVAVATAAAVLVVPSAGASGQSYNGLIVFDGARCACTPTIWTMAPDGTAQTNLTPGIDAIDPAWSPDGTKIAYVRDAGTSEQIWVMNADGSNNQELTSGYYDVEPTWSPDGGEIAFISSRPGNGSSDAGYIWLMDSDGSNLRQITNASTTGKDQLEENPSWSPDGTRIAFDDFLDVYAINADGSSVRQLTTDPASDTDPAFSPDGQKIAFVSNRGSGGWNNIYVMNADGSDQTALTTGYGIFNPAWSPDGTKIAYAATTSSPNSQIWTMNADGSDQTALIADQNTRYARPSWQSVSSPPSPTATSLSCTPDSVAIGAPGTTCIATVSDTVPGPTPSGVVAFTSNAAGSFSEGAACDLANGSCQLTYTPSTVGTGTHQITASYRGDWNHQSSSTVEDVTATPTMFDLRVDLAGNGSGTVTSSPTGISCNSDCSHAFPAGSVITLTAQPATGSVFSGWSGACTGQANCTLTLTASETVNAAFTPKNSPPRCDVPKLRGKVLAVAKKALHRAHCSVGTIRTKSSNAVAKGHVISQKPRPLRHVAPGTRVNLIISSGKR